MNPDLMNSSPITLVIIAVIAWAVLAIIRWKESRWTR
jgi:uncharacterized protein HemY